MEELLKTSLTQALAPLFLEIHNESHEHQNHKGSPQTGESHFFIIIYAPCLKGLSRVEAHRHVNEAVKEAWDKGLHALRIHILKDIPTSSP